MSKFICKVLAALAAMFAAQHAFAQTSVWINGGAGHWDTASNWSLGVPDSNKDVNVGVSGFPGTAQIYATDALARIVTLGTSSGTTGTIQLFSLGGIPGTLDTATVFGVPGITVGSSGTGILTLSGKSSVSSNGVDMAVNTGSAGTITVTSNNAILDAGLIVSTWADRGSANVTVSGGGRIQTGSVIMAQQTASAATVKVTDAGSNWSVNSNVYLGSYLASGGVANLTLTNGGLLTMTGASKQVSIGSLSTLNIGDYSVSGLATPGLISGANGLSANGTLKFDHNSTINITTPLSGTGQISHTGPGTTTLASLANFTGNVAVSDGILVLQGGIEANSMKALGIGLLRLSGNTVNLGNKAIRADDVGIVEYSNAVINGGFLRGTGTHVLSPAGDSTFNGVTTFSSTTISQDGAGSFNNFANGGTFYNNAALQFDGVANSSSGNIVVSSFLYAADLINNGVVSVVGGGVLTNTGGRLVAGGGSRTTIDELSSVNTPAGSFELNGALLVNNGTITGTVNVNYGSLAKGTGAYDDVNVNEGGVYSPGNSPGICTAASVELQSGLFTSGAPRLIMELGGTTPGTQYDQLHVSGELILNGTLDVQLVDLGTGLYSPQAGDSFDILDWGTLSGMFSSIDLPTLPDTLAWNTSQLYTSGVLSVASAGVPGDYSGNGTIDAADYVVWRKGLDITYTQNDYDVWRSHYGQTAASGAGSIANAAVPEPIRAWTLLMGLLALCLHQRIARAPIR